MQTRPSLIRKPSSIAQQDSLVSLFLNSDENYLFPKGVAILSNLEFSKILFTELNEILIRGLNKIRNVD